MSHVSQRFLLESVLLDTKAQETSFAGVTDAELLAALADYRVHVLDHLAELQEELPSGANRLGAYFGTSLCSGPKTRQLLRASLYFDLVVIDDPLFPHGRTTPPAADAIASFLGYEPARLNRQAVVEAARLLKGLLPLVASGLLKLVPAGLAHELPREIPISYSPSLFADTVPAPILRWFHDRVEVSPMVRRGDSGWKPRLGETLEPCRGIFMSLPGFDESRVFHLMRIESLERVPGRENLLDSRQSIPDEPPDRRTFRTWITQSVNQFAGDVYGRVTSDMLGAAASGTMMFTDSSLVSDLLELQMGAEGRLQDDLASLAMRFELPFLEELSVDDLMIIRESEGEAFESFRVELQRRLRDLRGIESDEELGRRLEAVQHEMAEVQVREVAKDVERLKGGLLREAVIGTASLATVIPSQGLSVAALLFAGNKVWQHAQEYREVRRAPGYFVWRLLQRRRQ